MKLPDDLLLPLFSYGIFQLGELGFLRIQDLVKSVEDPCLSQGHLLVRDGLPIFEVSEDRAVRYSYLEHSK